MAYSANDHARFSERIKALAKNFQAELEEFERLDLIYINETSSGGDAAFVDTEHGTKQEHIDMIVLGRAFRGFIEGEAVAALDRRPNLSPFLQ